VHPMWFKHNPKYILKLLDRGDFTATITLYRQGEGWKRNAPLEDMIGFYVVSADDQGNVASPSSAIVAETAFVPDSSCQMTFTFRPTAERPCFVIVPCTYGCHRQGKFQVTVSASSDRFHFAAAQALSQAGG
jgi:Calpain large subunit, domain III